MVRDYGVEMIRDHLKANILSDSNKNGGVGKLQHSVPLVLWNSETSLKYFIKTKEMLNEERIY